MTLQECITAIDTRKPNNYTTAQKIEWLSFLEFTIINEVLKTHEGYNGEYDDFNGYSEDDLSVTLIITSPYDSVYVDYLEMRIDEANGETSIYNASASQYNAKYLEYKKWYNKTHLPLSISGGTSRQSVQKYTVELSDAEKDSIIAQLEYVLTNKLGEMVADDKLYEIATNYFSNNNSLFKGEKGEKGDKGKDGTSFTYNDLTDEQKKELKGNADIAVKYSKIAESWAIGGTGERTGETENNAKHYANAAQQSAEIAETQKNATITASTSAVNASTNANNSMKEAKISEDNALEQALYSESWAIGGTGYREGEDTNNSHYYCEKAQESADTCSDIYSNLLKAFQNEVAGTGAIRLEDVNSSIPTAKVECESPVTMYGKNLDSYNPDRVNNNPDTIKSNWDLTGNDNYAYYTLNVPCDVTLSLYRDKIVGTFALNEYDESGTEISSETLFNTSKYTEVTRAIAKIEGHTYKLRTSKNAVNFMAKIGTDTSKYFDFWIQVEVGTASEYEEYKEPVVLENLDDVKLYSPTATLIASPNAEIKATYTKDINRTIERLENAIANS